MNKASLFSGVGGIDLAADWAGMETVAFCEREALPQRILHKHWPNVPIIDDVYKFTREELNRLGVGTIDIISAGFPCQPFSAAGNREGSDDERYLWPEVVRVLQDIKPTWFVGENVAGLLSMAEPDGQPVVESRTIFHGEEEDLYEAIFTQQEIMLFGRICKDLEDIDYQVQPFVVPAAAVGAQHQRERVFIVAYTDSVRDNGAKKYQCDRDRQAENGKWEQPQHRSSNDCADVADTSSEGLPQRGGTGISSESEKNGTRSNNRSERCRETLANTPGERCGETGSSIGRSEAWSARRGDPCEDVGYTESNIVQRQLPLWNGALERGHLSREWASDGTEQQGPTQPGMGRVPDEFSAWLDGSGVNPLDALSEIIATYPQPASLGMPQHDWEPPRVATGVKDRAARLKALGNAVDPLQIYPIMCAIKAIDDQL